MRGASLTTCLTFKFVPQNSACSASACLLPLLYQTPTLLSKPKTARSFPAANRYVNYHDRHTRTLSTTTQRQAGAETDRLSDPIAFVDSNGYGSSDAPSDNRSRKNKSSSSLSSLIKPQKEGQLLTLQKNEQQNQIVRPSTMTAAEQTAFDTLIKEVSGPTFPEEDDDDILDQEEPFSAYDPNIDLDKLFEEAIKRLREMDERAAEAAARNRLNPVSRQRAIDYILHERQALTAKLFKRPLESFKRPLETLNKVKFKRPFGEPVSVTLILETASDKHRSMVLSQLDQATSDEKIWQILQDEVFSLVTRLNEDVKKTELADETGGKKKRKTRKARKATVEEKRAGAAGKDTADVGAEQHKPHKEENLSANLSTTKAIPINELLVILHRNYAEYCLHTLRLFRRKYPTSLYAMHVLATIKDLGPISYVLGVSTDIYNEFIFLQWTQYSDLHGMADTMAEMLNQGIEGNDVTITLIKGIARQRRNAKGSFAGPVMKEWWHMRGNVEGWRRLQDCYQQIIEKLAERSAALSEEVGSEDEAVRKVYSEPRRARNL